MSKVIDNLSRELKTKEIIFGVRVALKKSKDIEKIYLSTDCPENIVKRLQKFSNVIKTELTREELRELCKKDFNISVISLLKEKKKKQRKKR